jgi:hypothetical protein
LFSPIRSRGGRWSDFYAVCKSIASSDIQYYIHIPVYNVWCRVSKISLQEMTFDGMRFEVLMAMSVKLSSGM